MAMQISTSVQNAALDAFETATGTAAVLRIFTGAQPANCAATNSGTELANMTLPTDWMAAAASNSKAKLGTWEELSAIASGTAGHYRMYASDGTTCHFQGTVTATGGGGDMEINSTGAAVSSGQKIEVTTYAWAMGNS